MGLLEDARGGPGHDDHFACLGGQKAAGSGRPRPNRRRRPVPGSRHFLNGVSLAQSEIAVEFRDEPLRMGGVVEDQAVDGDRLGSLADPLALVRMPR